MKYQVCTVVGLLATSAIADVITVNINGGGDFTTIQAAVDAASNGDEILVWPGTYTASSAADTWVVSSANLTSLSICSTNGPESTIIDGENEFSGVRLSAPKGFPTDITFAGFHFRNVTIGGVLIDGDSGGIVTFENCIFEECSGFGGVRALDLDVVVQSCVFSDNHGSGVSTFPSNEDDRSLTLDNCTFENSEGFRDPGTSFVYADVRSILITNSTFTRLQADEPSGGGISDAALRLICPSSGYTGVLVSNSTFSENSRAVSLNGNLVFDTPSAYPAFVDCEFLNNAAIPGEVGAGVSVGSATTPPHFTRCLFEGNSSSSSGAAIYGPVCSMTDCQFRQNTAYKGGALFLFHYDSSLPPGENPCQSTTFTDCTFEENVSTAPEESLFRDGGGAIFLWSTHSAVLDTCTFIRNTAGNWGGAILFNQFFARSLEMGSLTCTDCVFTENSSHDGGACALTADDAESVGGVTFSNCDFMFNGATNGGACMARHMSPRFDGCTFSDNLAVYLGGALCAVKDDPVGDRVVTANGCTWVRNVSFGTAGAIAASTSLNSPTNVMLLNLNECTFTDCEADDGGALWTTYTDTVLDNCDFRSNAAVGNGQVGGSGGAIHLGRVSTLTSTDCSFEENEADFGGALKVSDFDPYGTQRFASCQFTGNSATHSGGALDVSGQNGFTAVMCTFTDNNAVYGGAVRYSSVSSAMDLDQCTFRENTGETGGALFVTDDGLSATGCTFVDNTSTVGDGGAILLSGNGDLADVGGEFTGNSAVGSGGAVCAVGASFAQTNGIYSGNQASEYGGAISVSDGATLNVQSISISGTAGTEAVYGGGIDIDGKLTTAEIWDSTIANCTASAGGGGVYANGLSALITGCRIRGNSAPYGGGVASSFDSTYIEQSLICANLDDQVSGRYTDWGGNHIEYECCLGDINEDGVVDGADLTLLLGDWGPCPGGGAPCPGDLNEDGVVNGADLTLLLGGWGPCPL